MGQISRRWNIVKQAEYRPAVVISNYIFNNKTKLVIVCPITNTDYKVHLHIPLDKRTKTNGVILCEHVKSLDLRNRKYEVIENLPQDILENIINIIYAEIEEFD